MRRRRRPTSGSRTRSRLEPLVTQIRAHGGEVVVRAAADLRGGSPTGSTQHYPRARYWDVFAGETSAHVMHYHDLPATRDLVCPDEMHLDPGDQAAFTRALIDALRERHLLREP